MVSTENIAILACAAFVFLCIGLPTFLMGCNPNVERKCVAYNVFNGYVYKTQVYEHTCSECAVYSTGGKCTAYRTYTCYNGYVWGKSNKDNTTCYITVDSQSKSKSNVQNTLDDYHYGEKVNWLKIKTSTNECKTSSETMDLWIVGVTFLSLIGFVLLIFIAIVIYELCNKYEIFV